MNYEDLLAMVDPEAVKILNQGKLTSVVKVITMDQGPTKDGRRLLAVFGAMIVDEETPTVAESVARIEISKDTMKERRDLIGCGLAAIVTSEPWQSS